MISAFITLLLAAPATISPSPTCELTDSACKARLFIAKAAKAPPPQRALYLFTAHRSYVALFVKTGEVNHLCAARSNFDRSLAIAGQGEPQRASFERSRAELESLEAKSGARCDPSRKRARTPPPRIAGGVASAPAPMVPPPPFKMSPGPLLEVPTASAKRAPIVLARPMDATPRRLEAPPTDAGGSRVPGRPLVIAGGTTIGLGLVLAGIAGYAGSQLADTSRRAFANYDENNGHADVDAFVTDAALRREHGRWVPVTIGTAVAGAGGLVVGAVLVRMGVRKQRHGPPRAALLPIPGGLAVRARF